MKKIIILLLSFACSIANAQTFVANNLQVNGASSFAATANFNGSAIFGPSATFNNGLTANGTNSINGYATLASPAFTGVPDAPTAPTGTNTVQIANTAFVANHAPCPSILDNGGNNGGVVDNTAAFAATAALGPSGQACVYFPPGTYAFSAQLVYAIGANASIKIEGAGIANTKLFWPGGGGLYLGYGNSVSTATIKDLSVISGAIGAGTGISLVNSGTSGNAQAQMSVISNVSVYGSGFIATNYWGTGIFISNVSNVNLLNTTVVGANATYQTNGVGLNLQGASTSSEAVQINIWGSNFSYVGTGILYGSYVQGVTVTNSNFTGNNLGISTNAANANQSGLTVVGSQFNCLQYGIYDQTPQGIAGLLLGHNYFELPYNGGTSVVAVLLNKVYQMEISGNIIERIGGSASGLNGIVIAGSSTIGGIITGNNIFAMTTGIWLQTGSTNINVQSNFYSANGTNVVNSCSSGCTVGGGSQ